MSNKPLKISEQAAVQMPMKTVASLISLVAIGTWAFFGIQENLNRHATKLQIRVDGMLHNEVNITALTKAVEKLQSDVEKLKDKQRSFANGSHE